MAANPNSDSQESLPHFPPIFPSVHESELGQRNKSRGRCSFSQFLPKKIRRRQSTCSAPVTSSTGCVGSAEADEFGVSHVLQPRPISDLLLVNSSSCNLYLVYFLVLVFRICCMLLKCFKSFTYSLLVLFGLDFFPKVFFFYHSPRKYEFCLRIRNII